MISLNPVPEKRKQCGTRNTFQHYGVLPNRWLREGLIMILFTSSHLHLHVLSRSSQERVIPRNDYNKSPWNRRLSLAAWPNQTSEWLALQLSSSTDAAGCVESAHFSCPWITILLLRMSFSRSLDSDIQERAGLGLFFLSPSAVHRPFNQVYIPLNAGSPITMDPEWRSLMDQG